MSEIKTWEQRQQNDGEEARNREHYMRQEISDLRAALAATQERERVLVDALTEIMHSYASHHPSDYRHACFRISCTALEATRHE